MTLQTDLEQAVARAKTDSDRLKAIVNGPADGTDSTVAVDSGPVKTVARALAEIGDASNLALKDLSNVSMPDLAAALGLGTAAAANTGALAGDVPVNGHWARRADDTGSYAVVAGDNHRLLEIGGGDPVVTLPEGSTLHDGFDVVIKSDSASPVAIVCSGSDLIDDTASFILAGSRDSVRLRHCGGGAWRVAGHYRAVPPGGVPTGAMLDHAGAGAPPDGYLLCDGANVSRTTYAALFDAIGTVWGEGDGATTFTLPDSRRRVTVGAGGTGTAVLGSAVGDVGGAESHTLTVAEMPAHSHTYTLRQLMANVWGSAANSLAQLPQTENTGTTGDSGAHNNLQPSLVVQKIIRT